MCIFYDNKFDNCYLSLPTVLILLQPGDRVFTVRTVSGCYSEFAVADENHTFNLHGNLSFVQGAALGIPYFTAYKALIER